MADSRKYRDVVVFTALYLLLSFPPFVFLNREGVGEVRDRLAPLDIVTVAAVGTGLALLVTALVVADEGVDRYNQFLFAPTDLLSVVVELSFVVAAVSWWAVPELATRYQGGVAFEGLLLIVLVCQLPMVLFLSLLTAVGRA